MLPGTISGIKRTSLFELNIYLKASDAQVMRRRWTKNHRARIHRAGISRFSNAAEAIPKTRDRT